MLPLGPNSDSDFEAAMRNPASVTIGIGWACDPTTLTSICGASLRPQQQPRFPARHPAGERTVHARAIHIRMATWQAKARMHNPVLGTKVARDVCARDATQDRTISWAPNSCPVAMGTIAKALSKAILRKTNQRNDQGTGEPKKHRILHANKLETLLNNLVAQKAARTASETCLRPADLAGWLAKTPQVDGHGSLKRGSSLPQWIGNKKPSNLFVAVLEW